MSFPNDSGEQSSPHYSRETLEKFCLGKVDPQQSAEIEQHLGNCLDCASIFESIPNISQDSFVRKLRRGVLMPAVGDGAPFSADGSPFPLAETRAPESVIARRELSSPDVSTNVANSDSEPLPSTRALSQTYLPPTTDKVLQSRYRIVRMLGEGGFGHVYLAVDLELERQVAIKVPRPERFLSPIDAEGYLTEAKIVASLNHPHIVPIYETGRTSDGMIFVVSRFIAGPTLDKHVQQQSLDTKAIVAIVKTVALALDYAHSRRLIHRDVKPANILIELDTDTPYVTDFGLAIREEDYAIASRGGSPAYMSPEQVRGEGHRLDGRSDVFALGVVLYELLTQKKPFIGSTLEALFHQIIMVDPTAPREVVDSIPPELERICLKALSKQVSDRYASAAAMAQDLENWLSDKPKQNFATSTDGAVKHKGLRAYDASDAAYFFNLLPGTRESDGLPQLVSFWKHKIEETDPQMTFAVGLILGPSGCGKSSMVRAGLLPSIANRIKTLYVEATSADTEARILTGLHKLYPALKNSPAIDEAFASLRRSTGSKVIVVIDQFEQWLHARPLQGDDPLVQALRQCDGGQMQVILMVRDDFSMAAARLMRLLDIRILEGNNFATVDLFDTSHATNVLTRFGQAFGQVPRDLTTQADSTKKFVQQVIAGLAIEGKIISVQLALFAEMVKDKPWTLDTLEQVGGTEGVGVNFLEETFGSRGANPEIRLHAVAARAVLNALLPEGPTDIKGHMRSHSALLAVSGYQHRPDDFATLLSILDSQLRLITPTEPEEQNLEATSHSADGGRSLFYQLTHDYLVPSLREWLTRKQRETRQGRAELKLAERTAAWSHSRENKQLPSVWEWLAIRRWTDQRQWKTSEAALMRQATRHHAQRLSLGTVAVVVLAMGALFMQREVIRQQTATRFEGLVRELISAEPMKIPSIVQELDQNPQLAATYLSPLLAQTGATPGEMQSRLHAQLASVSRDSALTKPLVDELLNGKVTYVLPIRQLLKPSVGRLKDELLAILRSKTESLDRRFRASLALADTIPASDITVWSQSELAFVAEQLLSANAEHQPLLLDALRPLREQLLADLERVFIDEKMSDAQRMNAADALADYAGNDVPKLAELLTVATPEQYAVLFRKVSASGNSAARESLQKLTQQVPHDDLRQAERIELGRRRAGAAIALLRQGERESIFDVMRVTTDPESLSQFVARCKPCGVSVKELLDCVERCDAKRQSLTAEPRKLEDRVLYGLLLALGDFPIESVDETIRQQWRDRVGQWFANDPSSTVHGATGWLLRRWDCLDQVTRVEQTPVKYDPTGRRDWFNLVLPPVPDSKVDQTLVSFTFVVFPAGEYRIGSPLDEDNRQKGEGETLHTVSLSRPVAICDRELTWSQFDSYDNGEGRTYWAEWSGRQLGPRDPMHGCYWYHAIDYCRWLTTQFGLAEGAQCYDDPAGLANGDSGAPQYKIYLERSGFRLPTEAEWEVACRSGSRSAYSFGCDPRLLTDYAWCLSNSEERPHTTSLLRPNAQGLFDIHGNLLEWTHDWYSDQVENSVDPIGPSSGKYRVLRGGAWDRIASSCRASYRSTYFPATGMSYIGFRLALSPTAETPK